MLGGSSNEAYLYVSADCDGRRGNSGLLSVTYFLREKGQVGDREMKNEMGLKRHGEGERRGYGRARTLEHGLSGG